MIFQYFSRQISFSMTFQESPLNSSTFQACANPVVMKVHFPGYTRVLTICISMPRSGNCRINSGKLMSASLATSIYKTGKDMVSISVNLGAQKIRLTEKAPLSTHNNFWFTNMKIEL